MDSAPTNESPTSRSNLWRRSIVSTSWTFTANLVVFSLLLIRAILLARWLPIEVFGIYVMASAVVELSSIVADLGLGEAFLHRAPETEDEDRAAATHLTLKLVLVTSWALLVAAIAWVVCRGEMKVAVLVLVGTTMSMHVTQTPRVLLTRRVQHGRLALLRIVTAVVGTGVALGLAAAGATLWSLLSVDLVTSGVALAGLYLWRPVWRPRLAWSWARVRYFVGFGGRSFMATLLLRGIERLDDLWTGLYLGDVALGLYSRAFGFATFPRRLIATPVSEVLGGTYAELKGDRQGLSTAFFVSNSTLVRVCFPIAGGIVLVAPELVGVLLGEKWLPMVPAFRLLTVFTLLDPLRYSLAGLFTAVGRPHHAVAVRMLQLVVLFAGLTIFGPVFGITGVALAVTITALSGALGMTLLARRYVDVSVVRMMAPPSVGLIIGGILAVAAGHLGGLPAWAAPWLELVVFGLGYTACLLLLEGRQLRGLIRIGKDLAPTGGPMHRSGSGSVLARNLLELVHLVGDCAPRVLVSSEGYRRLRQLLSRTPQRYEPLAERAMPFTDDQWRERKLVSRFTDLCIEGFPGSGSSFVSNSLRMAVDRPTNIESHFHQTAQLKRALSFGVPAVVVVRDPAGACASLRSKEPSLASWVVLLRWIHYHRWVSRHLDRLDVFLFDELVDDVDLLRRRSPVVNRLVAGTIEPRGEFRRASRTRVPIDQSRVLSWVLLSVARAIYKRIEADRSNAVDGRPSRSEPAGRG